MSCIKKMLQTTNMIEEVIHNFKYIEDYANYFKELLENDVNVNYLAKDYILEKVNSIDDQIKNIKNIIENIGPSRLKIIEERKN